MPEFRYIKLGEDINSAVSSEIKNDTWLIYPTERSCREAMTAFQKVWQPLNISFLSMDEFKQKVIFSNQIRLQDEKRLVCLFQAMTAEDRSVFHIEKYSDLIEWGQHFFELFEELAEEEIDANALLKRIEGNEVFCQQWQVQNYSRMLAILQQYRDLILSKGFTDAVFDNKTANLKLPDDIRRYVFVNQFYYSRLEQSIIKKLSERRLEAVICYQGPEAWLDKDSLRSAEFNPEEAFPEEALPFTLQVVETTSPWQMALAFLKDYSPETKTEQQEHFIIDAGFLQQPYHKLFSRRHFRYSESRWIHGTRLYHFLQAMGQGLENLVRIDGRVMVRLDWLLQAIGLEGFISYFRPDISNAGIDDFTGFICRFADEDVLYLDLRLELLNLPEYEKAEQRNVELLKEIMALLKHLNGIDSAFSLAEVIDSDKGISIDKLLSEEEKTSTTLQENFYTGLANFSSMDELALVDDWQQLYPGMPLSSCIFALFLNFIRPRRYQVNLQEDLQPSATITNIMDTRNLQTQKLTFLNLTEGILPGSRTPVWLFNEKQLQEIGLKTWEDVRNWERHYFYRIIATARDVNIYTVSNRDRDIEPSSFLSELHEFYRAKVKPEKPIWNKLQISADTGLKNLLAKDAVNPLAEPVAVSELSSPDRHDSFFRIPFDPEADFGIHKSVSVSWSSCEHLLYNPVLFLLQDVKRLRKRYVQVQETLNRRMFGKLLHHYLMVINQRLESQHNGLLSMQWEWLTNDFLQSNLNHALSSPKLVYQMPANYNREFLAELLAPFLTDTAGKFFRKELSDRLDSSLEFITIIPEQEDSTELEKRYKRLMDHSETENGFSINIKGRADLRLETDNDIFIIDFKTGGYHELQLIFYMWFYYLIEHPELENKIRTFVYKLLEKKLVKVNTTGKKSPQTLKDELKSALDRLLEEGYTHPQKISDYDPAQGISRPDLLRNIIPEEGEE